MQRLLASLVLAPKKQHELLRITEALDPLRLLTQLEHLQKALWRHAVKPETISATQAPASTLRFSVESVSEEKLPGFRASPYAAIIAQAGAEKTVSKKWAAA